MLTQPEKVTVRTPNKPGYAGGRVDAAKYAVMKKLLLEVLPKKPPGSTQREMFAAVAKAASKATFPGTTSSWWAKTVQLDLEARGEVVRDPTAKPLRWRRTR